MTQDKVAQVTLTVPAGEIRGHEGVEGVKKEDRYR